MQLELFTQQRYVRVQDGKLYVFITWQAYDYRMIGDEVIDLGEVRDEQEAAK